jgi:hypothetical protein
MGCDFGEECDVAAGFMERVCLTLRFGEGIDTLMFEVVMGWCWVE